MTLPLHRRTVLGALGLLPFASWAQDNAPLEYVLGYAPGGSADAVGRLIAEHLGRALGRPVVVTNKPGAGTTIAAQYVAAARQPMLFNADFATLAAMPHMMAKIPYDPEKDFAPVSMLARVPLLLAVHPGVPVHNVKEFLAWAKAKPEGVPYSSAGPGSPHHLVGEVVKELIGTRLVHVPYKGAGPAVQDLIAGQIQVGLTDLGSAKPHLAAGKIRGIAIASVRRSPAAPDVPTFDEQGYPGFEAYAWQAVLASNATPAETRLKFNTALHAALNAPDVKNRLESLGVEPLPTTPEHVASYTRTERARWGEVIRKHNIRID
jgi:tripartite-type tricarboxylate transporter receptor subunit TctC